MEGLCHTVDGSEIRLTSWGWYCGSRFQKHPRCCQDFWKSTVCPVSLFSVYCTTSQKTTTHSEKPTKNQTEMARPTPSLFLCLYHLCHLCLCPFLCCSWGLGFVGLCCCGKRVAFRELGCSETYNWKKYFMFSVPCFYLFPDEISYILPYPNIFQKSEKSHHSGLQKVGRSNTQN